MAERYDACHRGHGYPFIALCREHLAACSDNLVKDAGCDFAHLHAGCPCLFGGQYYFVASFLCFRAVVVSVVLRSLSLMVMLFCGMVMLVVPLVGFVVAGAEQEEAQRPDDEYFFHILDVIVSNQLDIVLSKCAK